MWNIFFFLLQISICKRSFVAFEQRKGSLFRRETGLIKLQSTAGSTVKYLSSSGTREGEEGEALGCFTVRWLGRPWGSSRGCWSGFKSCKHTQGTRAHVCMHMAPNLHRDACHGLQTRTELLWCHPSAGRGRCSWGSQAVIRVLVRPLELLSLHLHPRG